MEYKHASSLMSEEYSHLSMIQPGFWFLSTLNLECFLAFTRQCD